MRRSGPLIGAEVAVHEAGFDEQYGDGKMRFLGGRCRTAPTSLQYVEQSIQHPVVHPVVCAGRHGPSANCRCR